MNKKLKFVFFIFLSLFFITSDSAQTPSSRVSVSGLQSVVNLRRDNRGIPYIEAQNEADLYFAQGYVTASDRLWQMDLYRRVARGETAEIFGKTTLEEDKRWRKFGFASIAEENVKLLDAETRTLLENYARGVNAYIATLDDKSLPVEFQILRYKPREWIPADSIVVSKIFDDGLSNTWQSDLMKASLMDLPKAKLNRILDPSSPLDVILVGNDGGNANRKMQSAKSVVDSGSVDLEKIAAIDAVRKSSLERIGFYAEELAASNNWVVSGKKTVDGKTMLANDPHLQATQPPIWYLVNLSTPNLKVAGVSTPGLPGVIIGHNENIAWGMTNVGPDVQDLYVETFDAERKVKTLSGYEPAKIRREEIKFRQQPLSPQTETEILEVVQTKNGVIYYENADKKYALKWTAFEPKNDSLKMIASLAKAKNWTDFRNAIKLWSGAAQNFVYADVQGNIGWTAAGKIPLRRTGDGSLPYDGASADGDWTGFVPFEELPSLYNPPNGFIMTANQRTVGKSYKYQGVIARQYTVSRAKRLQNLLDSKAKISADDMSDFQYDLFSIVNSRFAKEVIAQKAASDETLKLLSDWDGRLNHESKAALVVDRMRGVFRSKILQANLGAERGRSAYFPNDAAFFDRLLAEKPADWLPKEYKTYADLLRACETEAKAGIAQTLGADETKWTWGAVTKSNFPHPLAIAPLIGTQFKIAPLAQNGSSGAGASPNVGMSVSMRFVATPGNWDMTRHVIPTGESGNPKSAHWKDQLDAWYTGKTPIFPFSKAAIESAAREIVVLEPKL